MLGSIRKFSSSIYAKVFLFIVAIPFVFWGMGDVFRGGNLNTIVIIDKEKIHTQEFIGYLKMRSLTTKELNDSSVIQRVLSDFIGEKLILNEIKKYKIKLSNESLSKIIKNHKKFMRDGKFSRTEYEKFLIENNYSAIFFEERIKFGEKKNQLQNFLGGGIIPPDFLVNMNFNKINQKRKVEYIDLNKVIKKKKTFPITMIQKYFDENKESFEEIFKSVKFLKLEPKILSESNEFTDLFFKRIDEIEDLIAQGRNLDFILKNFNIEKSKTISINKSRQDKELNTDESIPQELVEIIFETDISEPTVLAEIKNNYFVFEINKTEIIQRNLENEEVNKKITANLNRSEKREFIVQLIDKINNNEFKKNDFDNLIKKNNLMSKKINLENRNDDSILKKGIVEQIYSYSDKKVVVVTDIGLTQNFLVYIDSIENVTIDKNLEDQKKYSILSKDKIVTSLYNTYDAYLKNKYEIDINYKALEGIKNYIR